MEALRRRVLPLPFHSYVHLCWTPMGRSGYFEGINFMGDKIDLIMFKEREQAPFERMNRGHLIYREFYKSENLRILKFWGNMVTTFVHWKL